MRRTTLSLLLVLTTTAAAEDWPAFRGPSGDGVSNETKVPVTWDADTNVRWKTPLSRAANGSPIVSGGRVFLASAEDEEGRSRSLLCFDRATGRQLWSRAVTIDRTMPTHGTNPYGGSTPAADGRRVVVWHASAGLHCYDFEGEKLWSRDLGEFRHQWGYGTSPVLHDGKVILHSGPGQRSFVAALDLRDGTTIWEVDEPAPVPPDGKKRLVGSWCTPLITTFDGQAQIICGHPTRTVAYALDGSMLWSCEGISDHRGHLTYSSPIVSGDICMVRGGYEGPEIGMRLGGTGDVTASHRLWRHSKRPSNVGSGVARGGHAFVPDIDGHLVCVDLATGERLWRQRATPGQMWGSIVYAAGHLYVTNQRGTTVVFRPDPEKLDVVAVNALGEKTNATPAISDGEIFIRTHEHLFCIAREIE